MIGYVSVDEQVEKDFDRALLKASLHRLRNHLRRRDGAHERLLSFEEAKSTLAQWTQAYRGMRIVEVEKIVGSVGRYQDFDGSFLPLKVSMGERWGRIDRAYHRGDELPAVSLYKIGDAYFVQDGNHRVSVARERGIEMIDAEVVELKSRVPIDSAVTARDLLYKLEHRRLLERLPIDRVVPELKVELTDVADYRYLATYIEAHGFRLSQLWRRYVSPEEVLRDWYEHSYTPIATMIREERILDAFPERTELDLYLWIIRHRERLALEARDESVTPSTAKDDILRREGRKPRDPRRFVNIYG